MTGDLFSSAFATFVSYRGASFRPSRGLIRSETEYLLSKQNSFLGELSFSTKSTKSSSLSSLEEQLYGLSQQPSLRTNRRPRYAELQQEEDTQSISPLPLSILPPVSLLSTSDLKHSNSPISSSASSSVISEIRENLDTSQLQLKRKVSSSVPFLPPLATLSSSQNKASISEDIFDTGIPCRQCKKIFLSKDELKKHQKSHTRPFPCQIKGCSASFSKANHLTRHVKIVHNKERPYACTVPACGSRFGSKSHLGDHTRAVHMRLRTYKCTICGASWSKRFNLQKHIRIRHLRQKPYHCIICNMSFGTVSHAARHKHTIHGESNATFSTAQ